MRRGVLVAVVAVCVLGAGGCSQPTQPATTLPTAPPATTTEETPATPTLEPMGPPEFPVPAEARVETDAGAEAAARYYGELIIWTYSSLDPTWLRELSRGCQSCNVTADGFDADRNEGLRYVGGEAVVSAFFDDYDSSGRSSVGLLIEQQAFQVLRPDGQVVSGGDVPERRLTGGALMSWDAARSAWITEQRDLTTS